MLHIFGQSHVSSEMTDVCVQSRCHGVVVARGQMGIALQIIALTSRKQHHLGVGLEPHHAVHHLRTDGLQHFSPVDVGFLIKAGL